MLKEVIGEVTLDPLHKLKASNGLSVFQMSRNKTTLIVFLRHLGCIFCRETLKHVLECREAIEQKGIQILLVHQSESKYASQIFDSYGLNDMEHLSDRDMHLYRIFGLKKGKVKQLLGLEVWKGGLRAMLRKKVIFGKRQGDVYQLSGFFLYRNGKIQRKYSSRHAADIPDLLKFTEFEEVQNFRLSKSSVLRN
ncbi:MAG: hypothetical protein Kapaf2KO_07510 [Candidatus Kapaibacteriales bacterium]